MNLADGFSEEHRNLLFELSLLIGERRGVDEIYASFADHIRLGITFTFTSLFVATEDPEYVRSVGHYPYSHKPTAAGTVHRARTLAADSALEFTEGNEFIPRFVDLQSARDMAESGLERAWITPLLVDGNSYGMLTVAKAAKGRFPDDHLRFLRAAAKLLAQAVRQDLELERARLLAARARAAQELTYALQMGESFERIFERIPLLLGGALKVDYAGLVVGNGDRFEMAAESPSGVYAGDSPNNENAAAFRAFADGQSFVQARPDVSFARPLVTAGYQRVALAFLRDGSDLQGALLLARLDARRFDRDEQGFISLLESILSQSLTNQRKAREKDAEDGRRRVLSDLAVLLQRGEDAAADFEGLQDLLRRALHFDFISVCNLDHTTGEYRCMRSPELLEGETPVPFDPQSIQRVQESGSSAAFATAEVPGRIPQSMARAGLRCGATAVITAVEGAEGLLTIGRRDNLPFSPEEMTFLELVSALLGQAASNLHKAETTAAQALRNGVLSELGLLLNNGEPIETHFQKLRELLLERVGFDFCGVSVRSAGRTTLRSMRSEPFPGDSTEEPPLELSVVHSVLSAGGFSVQYRPDVNDIGPRGGLARLGMARAAAFVLTTGGEPEGLLSIARRSETPFTAEEMQFFEVVSSLLAHAALNERRLAETIAEAEDQTLIADVAAAVARESDVLGIVRSLRSTFRFLPSPFANFGFLGESSLTFPTPGGPDVVLPLGADFQTTLKLGQVSVNNSSTGPGTAESRVEVQRIGMRSHILTRALSAGLPVGILVVGSRDAAFEPTIREERLCRLIADILGPAMANARASAREREEAEDQAIIAEAAAAAARESTPLGIVRGLRGAVGRFIPAPFVNFGFLEGENVRFPTREPGNQFLHIDQYFSRTLAEGQAVVPGTSKRVASGEPRLEKMVALGIEAHVLTRASSAGETTGLLLVGSRDRSFEPGPRQLRLCRLIADIVGPAMANANAAERLRAEAEEQRLIAEVAAVAAREAEPASLVAALHKPISTIVPRPILTFGYLEGSEVAFPRPDGSVLRQPMDAQATATIEAGQVAWPTLPTSISENPEANALGFQSVTSTAVQSGGALVGFLLIGSRVEGHVVGERELRIFRLIAQILGPAMENARTTLQARLDAEEQRLLAETARAVAAARAESELRDALALQVASFIPDSMVALFYREAEPNKVRIGMGSPVASGLFSMGGHLNRAFELGQAVAELNDDDVGQEARSIVGPLGIRRWLSTVAISAGESVGLMIVGTRDDSHRFSERDFRLCRSIADFVGNAMANLREISRRQQEAEEQGILAEAAAAIASASTQQELSHSLAVPIRRFVPRSTAMLFYDEGDKVSLYGTDQFLLLDESMRRALGGDQFVTTVSESSVLPPAESPLVQEGVARFVNTPITVAGTTLGVLHVSTQDAAYEFSEGDLRILSLIAGFTGPAMVNLRESQRRREEAEDQRILAEAAAALAAGATESEVLGGLFRPIRTFVPNAYVSFSYIEGHEVMLWDGRHRRPIHEFSRRVLDDGQAVGDIDTAPMTDASRQLIASVGIRRFVDTAASSAGAQIGLLFVGSPDEDYVFSERSLRLQRLLANAVGPAMANAREARRRDEDASDERIISEIAAIAARAATSAEVIEALPAAIAPLVPAAFSLYGYTEDAGIRYQLTRPEDRRALGGEELLYPVDEVGRGVIAEGQSVGTLADTPATENYAALGLHAYCATTYYASGAPAGVMLLSTTDPAFEFTDRVLALLRRVVRVVGPAVEASRAEAELARQEQLYALMLRSLSEGIILIDGTGHVMFSNALGKLMTQAIDPDDVAKNTDEIIELMPDDAREAFRAAIQDGVGARGRGPFELGGQPRWIDYEFVPLNDPVMKVLVVVTDVTADVEREDEQMQHRLQMEQASRLAALGELVGGVAHELNNPLTAILGFTEVMSLSPAAAPLAEELAIVQKEALRARNIVRDLLFIVKPGTSERTTIPVTDLVSHIERLRRTVWKQQSIGWDISIEEPCTVWGNEHQLTQVILNLITNAEHALVGRDDARISIRSVCRAGQTEISVSDTGSGMSEATRQRVFEPFFTTKQGLGTGLGLPLSYSIVQSHNGEFRVESEVGVGTTFTMILPSAPDLPLAAPPPQEPKRSGSTSVLVIDDEPSLRKVCQRLIASLGYECSTAESSAEAEELASHTAFDVVLCDYRLGSETADNVVAMFERVAPHLIQRMVIATGATTDAGVVELKEKHNLRLMAKPYGVAELNEMISGVLAAR